MRPRLRFTLELSPRPDGLFLVLEAASQRLEVHAREVPTAPLLELQRAHAFLERLQKEGGGGQAPCVFCCDGYVVDLRFKSKHRRFALTAVRHANLARTDAPVPLFALEVPRAQLLATLGAALAPFGPAP